MVDEIKRGAEARMVLDHPLVREAFESFYESLARQRQKAPVKDGELHTRLIMLEQCAHTFEAWFRAHIETGEMAKVSARLPKTRIFSR